MTTVPVDNFNLFQKICEKFVAPFQHTQSHNCFMVEVVDDVPCQSFSPKKQAYHMEIKLEPVFGQSCSNTGKEEQKYCNLRGLT
jgi:hypothetical protein